MNIDNYLELLNKIRNKAFFVKPGQFVRIDDTGYFVFNIDRERLVGYSADDKREPVFPGKEENAYTINEETFILQNLE